MTASRILIAGCGDLGCELARRLLAADPGQQKPEIIGLRRDTARLPAGVVPVAADVTQAASLQSLTAFAPDVLVYAVAAHSQTDDNYHAHYVQGLRNVLQALAPAGSLRRVLFVSSTRVYGQQTDRLLDESSLPLPADFGGRRLLEAEALLQELACPATVLRFSGIYGPGRERMLRLARDPLSWPPHNSWSNRIHRDDGAAFIAYLIQRVLSGRALEDCYVVTDSLPVSQHEVLHWLAAQLGIEPLPAAIPAVTSGKRLGNQRLQQTGFQLRYPDYRSGYASLMAGAQ